MERQIGEIFEHNGEWYQCVECDSCGKCSLRTTECGSGTKSDLADEVFGECSKIRRSDSKHAIFKKLEKVGEPYERFLASNHSIKVQRYRLPYRYAILPTEPIMILEPNYKNYIEIQIKQNEDMDENKLNLKPFSLKAAKAGKPVCTRDGHKARIICFDAKDTQPIIGLYEKNIDGIVREYLCSYHTDGRIYDDQDTGYDLMMLPEKKEGWVNVYYDNDASSHRGCRNIYDTKEQAVKEAGSAYIDTIKISWSE